MHTLPPRVRIAGGEDDTPPASRSPLVANLATELIRRRKTEAELHRHTAAMIAAAQRTEARCDEVEHRCRRLVNALTQARLVALRERSRREQVEAELAHLRESNGKRGEV